MHVVHEAGPCGFVIWCHLTVLGTQCAVVAPSSIPKRSGGRVKSERPDAMMLARLARSRGRATSPRCAYPVLATPPARAAASTLYRRHSIHRPTAAATPAQLTATALQKVGSPAQIAPRPYGAPQKLFAGRSRLLLDHRACPTIGSDRGCARSTLNR
jgi:hypothetical protein